MALAVVVFLSFLIPSLPLYGLTADSDQPITLVGKTMGTQYHIKFYGLRPVPIHQTIESILEQINDQMSTYRDDSEISRLNQNEAHQWVEVSPAVLEVSQLAAQVHKMTNGAFEPTVGRLVNLWGFGPQYVPNKIPDSETLKSTRERIGLEHIDMRTNPPYLRKLVSGIDLDFSGIAKGYAVDRVARQLESWGLTRYMVEIGGEVRVGAPKPAGEPWMIGIESPSNQRGQIVQALALQQQSLATSGDYRNYYEMDGKRYSHIIDPRTGYPIKHRTASVSVITKTCAEADALATGFMVLGAEKGLAIAEKYDIAVLFLVREGERFVEKASTAFTPFLAP
jgi:thiamine biosynthesis lipoprotein